MTGHPSVLEPLLEADFDRVFELVEKITTRADYTNTTHVQLTHSIEVSRVQLQQFFAEAFSSRLCETPHHIKLRRISSEQLLRCFVQTLCNTATEATAAATTPATVVGQSNLDADCKFIAALLSAYITHRQQQHSNSSSSDDDDVIEQFLFRALQFFLRATKKAYTMNMSLVFDTVTNHLLAPMVQLIAKPAVVSSDNKRQRLETEIVRLCEDTLEFAFFNETAIANYKPPLKLNFTTATRTATSKEPVTEEQPENDSTSTNTNEASRKGPVKVFKREATQLLENKRKRSSEATVEPTAAAKRQRTDTDAQQQEAGAAADGDESAQSASTTRNRYTQCYSNMFNKLFTTLSALRQQMSASDRTASGAVTTRITDWFVNRFLNRFRKLLQDSNRDSTIRSRYRIDADNFNKKKSLRQLAAEHEEIEFNFIRNTIDAVIASAPQHSTTASTDTAAAAANKPTVEMSEDTLQTVRHLLALMRRFEIYRPPIDIEGAIVKPPPQPEKRAKPTEANTRKPPTLKLLSDDPEAANNGYTSGGSAEGSDADGDNDNNKSQPAAREKQKEKTDKSQKKASRRRTRGDLENMAGIQRFRFLYYKIVRPIAAALCTPVSTEAASSLETLARELQRRDVMFAVLSEVIGIEYRLVISSSVLESGNGPLALFRQLFLLSAAIGSYLAYRNDGDTVGLGDGVDDFIIRSLQTFSELRQLDHFFELQLNAFDTSADSNSTTTEVDIYRCVKAAVAKDLRSGARQTKNKSERAQRLSQSFPFPALMSHGYRSLLKENIQRLPIGQVVPLFERIVSMVLSTQQQLVAAPIDLDDEDSNTAAWSLRASQLIRVVYGWFIAQHVPIDDINHSHLSVIAKRTIDSVVHPALRASPLFSDPASHSHMIDAQTSTLQHIEIASVLHMYYALKSLMVQAAQFSANIYRSTDANAADSLAADDAVIASAEAESDVTPYRLSHVQQFLQSTVSTHSYYARSVLALIVFQRIRELHQQVCVRQYGLITAETSTAQRKAEYVEQQRLKSCIEAHLQVIAGEVQSYCNVQTADSSDVELPESLEIELIDSNAKYAQLLRLLISKNMAVIAPYMIDNANLRKTLKTVLAQLTPVSVRSASLVSWFEIDGLKECLLQVIANQLLEAAAVLLPSEAAAVVDKKQKKKKHKKQKTGGEETASDDSNVTDALRKSVITPYNKLLELEIDRITLANETQAQALLTATDQHADTAVAMMEIDEETAKEKHALQAKLANGFMTLIAATHSSNSGAAATTTKEQQRALEGVARFLEMVCTAVSVSLLDNQTQPHYSHQLVLLMLSINAFLAMFQDNNAVTDLRRVVVRLLAGFMSEYSLSPERSGDGDRVVGLLLVSNEPSPFTIDVKVFAKHLFAATRGCVTAEDAQLVAAMTRTLVIDSIKHLVHKRPEASQLQKAANDAAQAVLVPFSEEAAQKISATPLLHAVLRGLAAGGIAVGSALSGLLFSASKRAHNQQLYLIAATGRESAGVLQHQQQQSASAISSSIAAFDIVQALALLATVDQQSTDGAVTTASDGGKNKSKATAKHVALALQFLLQQTLHSDSELLRTCLSSVGLTTAKTLTTTAVSDRLKASFTGDESLQSVTAQLLVLSTMLGRSACASMRSVTEAAAASIDDVLSAALFHNNIANDSLAFEYARNVFAYLGMNLALHSSPESSAETLATIVDLLLRLRVNELSHSTSTTTQHQRHESGTALLLMRVLLLSLGSAADIHRKYNKNKSRSSAAEKSAVQQNVAAAALTIHCSLIDQLTRTNRLEAQSAVSRSAAALQFLYLLHRYSHSLLFTARDEATQQSSSTASTAMSVCAVVERSLSADSANVSAFKQEHILLPAARLLLHITKANTSNIVTPLEATEMLAAARHTLQRLNHSVEITADVLLVIADLISALINVRAKQIPATCQHAVVLSLKCLLHQLYLYFEAGVDRFGSQSAIDPLIIADRVSLLYEAVFTSQLLKHYYVAILYDFAAAYAASVQRKFTLSRPSHQSVAEDNSGQQVTVDIPLARESLVGRLLTGLFMIFNDSNRQTIDSVFQSLSFEQRDFFKQIFDQFEHEYKFKGN